MRKQIALAVLALCCGSWSSAAELHVNELGNHDGGGAAGLGSRALPRWDAAALLLIGSGSGHSIKLSDPIPY
jgi:hypothetical protein